MPRRLARVGSKGVSESGRGARELNSSRAAAECLPRCPTEGAPVYSLPRRHLPHADARIAGSLAQAEPYFTINGAAACAAINGAPLQRQPDFQVRVTPSYAIPTNWGVVSAWVTYQYVGKRYEDTFGLQPLGTYSEVGAGVVADVGSHWEFAVRGTNLTNTIALTEGNAREAGVSLGVNNVLLGRALFGREINLSARYKF